MITWKYLPDEFQDCGILGEHPIEIYATIDTKRGCAETRPHVDIFSVVAVVEIYGPIRVDITKRIVTDRGALIYWEDQVLKSYLESRGCAEESA